MRFFRWFRPFFSGDLEPEFKRGERTAELRLYSLAQHPGWVEFKKVLVNEIFDHVRVMGENKSEKEVAFAAGVAHGLSLIADKMSELEVGLRTEQESRAERSKKTETGTVTTPEPEGWPEEE